MLLLIVIYVVLVFALVVVVLGAVSLTRTAKISKVMREMAGVSDYLCIGTNAKGAFQIRRMAFAAVDGQGKVMDAKLMKAAAVLRLVKVIPFQEIIGMNLHTVKPEALGPDSFTVDALKGLIKDFESKAR